MQHKFPKHGDLHGWTELLSSGDVPCLQSTQNALSNLKLKDDTILAGDIAVVILRDPLFAISLIRQLQTRRSKMKWVEITTIEHAVMMLGIEPFFAHFGATQTIEEILTENELAKNSVLDVGRRSYVASRLAQDWAAKANDLESEEVQVAALIHDVAEMLLWVKAPMHATLIKKYMKENKSLRSAEAQRKVIGVSLVEIEIELCKQWNLPVILLNLLSNAHKSQRMKLVDLAVNISRHCAETWNDAALPDDWEETIKLLGFETEEQAKDELIPFIESLMLRWDKHNRPYLLPPPPTLQATGEMSDE